MPRLCSVILIAATLAFGWTRAGAQTPTAGADWSSFLGNDQGTSYSPLDQINRANVRNLAPAWIFPLGGGLQNAAPAVADGVLYMIANDDRVQAFDAATGAAKWTYRPTGPAPVSRFPIRGSASVAVAHGLVYYGTRDNHLVALDAATGKEVWAVEIEDRDICSCQPSHGILVVKDKVIVGVRGDVAHRGYINAFDAKTGRHVWRWWTVPGPGEPGHETWPEYLWKLGGGATWYAGSYDPKLNLLYWGTANPQPIMGETSLAAKLWTNSLVALDVDTGKLRWGFQETPADPFDYDSASEVMLVDAPVNGQMTPLVVHSVKSGYTYVLNRVTGAFVAAYPHADYINWNKGIDAAGKAIEPIRLSKTESTTICPSYYGSRAANHGAYSPQTGLWYGSSAEFCSKLRVAADPPKLVEGVGFNASVDEGAVRSPQSNPLIGAFDPVTGKRRWAVAPEVPNISSLLATGGTLLFGSDLFGEMWALDAETGKKLWSFRTGVSNANPAISYAVEGKQYIAVATGGGGAMPARIRELWPDAAPRLAQGSSMLVVFTLKGEGNQ